MSAGRFPSYGQLVWTQTRYQLTSFWRTPIALFFTIALPLFMLVLLGSLAGDATVDTPDGSWPVRQFFTGGLAAFAAVSATYTNLANMVPIRRDEGVLKRWRGTPLPTWAYIAGFVVSAVAVAFVGVVLMIGFGVVVFDVDIDWAKMPAAVVTFGVGVASFAALGIALASLVRSASSAAAAANATVLPVAFVSDVFFQVDESPGWMEVVGNIFPLKAFVNAFQDCFTPFVDAPAFSWDRLAFVAAWGLAGLVVAVRNFRWEPSGSAPRGRRARRAASGAA